MVETFRKGKGGVGSLLHNKMKALLQKHRRGEEIRGGIHFGLGDVRSGQFCGS